ncbi:MAG TPA: UvrD-helicase domain-containing protein [Salinivirgaceae bacterium]|nr:UvrD-helicase domain-containing protein [Salinivirgaceae bacterium]
MTKKALTIYKASAGSGKTFMLTRHYLTLALETEKNYTHILAITFTRKATAEMRQRIVDELKLLSSNISQSEHAEYISKELGINLDELQIRSQKLLSSILHDYSNFSITTIDQFFQRIIRSLARELGLPAGYRIEMDEKKILSRAVEIMLDKTTDDEELFNLFLEYVKSEVIDENRSHIFHNAIIEFVEKILREDLKNAFLKIGDKDFKNIVQEYQQTLQTQFYAFEAELKRRTNNFAEQLQHYNLGLSDLKNGTRAKYLYNAVSNGFKFKTDDLKKLFATDIDEEKDKFLKKDFLKEVGNGYGGLHQIFISDCQYFTESYPQYYFAKNAHRNLWHILFFANIWREMNQIKQNENLFVIGDSPVLLSQIIDKNDTSFIFEKIANRFNHFLIDEFQDTSTLQWDNLRPFVANSMAQFNPQQQKGCVNNLIVGDVKQAIYRFRNGNWSLLNEQVDKELGSLGIDNQVLNHNWRSTKTIIDFNNTVFDILRKELPLEYFTGVPAEYRNTLKSLYKDYEQKYPPNKSEKQGYVQVVALEKDEYRETTVEIVVNQVLEMLDNGVQQGDIAILVRKAEHGQIIAEALLSCGSDITKHNLQIAMSDVLSVDKSIAINAIINTLQYLSNPQEEYYIWVAAWNVAQTLGTDTKKFFSQTPQTLLPLEFFDSLEDLKKSNIYDAVIRIIEIFKLNKNRDEIPFLSRFLNFITQYLESSSSDQKTFLKYWEDESSNIKIPSPSTSNAIQILTIHKSKGLEFKHVILPFVDWRIINSNKELVWVETNYNNKEFPVSAPFTLTAEFSTYKDLLYEEYFKFIVDSLNIIYVAFTRAKTSLSVYTTQKPIKNTVGEWIVNMFNIRDKWQGEIDYDDKGNFLKYTFGDSKFLYETSKATDEAVNIIDSLTINTDISVSVRNSDSFYPKDEDTELSGIEYGTVMHRIMEQITTLSSLDKAVNKVASTGILSREEMATISKKIEDAITQPQVSEWFSENAKIYNEHVLISPDGKLLRPDRIVETPDGKRILIDYKFTHEQSDEHINQVYKYAKTLEKAGKKVDSAYIWYMLQNKIVEAISNEQLRITNYE